MKVAFPSSIFFLLSSNTTPCQAGEEISWSSSLKESQICSITSIRSPMGSFFISVMLIFLSIVEFPRFLKSSIISANDKVSDDGPARNSLNRLPWEGSRTPMLFSRVRAELMCLTRAWAKDSRTLILIRSFWASSLRCWIGLSSSGLTRASLASMRALFWSLLLSLL